MGIRRWLNSLIGEPVKANFSADPLPGDYLFTRLLSDRNGLLTTISRNEAMSVPAVKRGRDMLCSIASLPLVQYAADTSVVPSSFLRQIDRVRPNVVVLAETIEDLLFEKYAYWRITETYSDDYPAYAEHIAPCRVTESDENGRVVIRIDGEEVDWSQIIKFESPNDGLLYGAGGRTIRRALLLEKTASMYADNPRPLDYITPRSASDVAGEIGDNEDAEATVDAWIEARKIRGTAYLPGWLEYHSVQTPTPAELQLIEQQRNASLDIANLMGIDPEDLGISTTSRTYQNGVDRRQDRVNDVLSMLMKAITDRLSMGDVTKTGYFVDFDLDGYLRADPLTRMQVQTGYLAAGVITKDEIRREERQGPLPAELRNAPTTRPVIRAVSTVGQPQPEIEAA